MPNAAGEPAGGSAVAPIAPAATPVDVLNPTCARPAALAVTLASLVGQTHRALGVIVSDQAEDSGAKDAPEVGAVVRVLRARQRATRPCAARAARDGFAVRFAGATPAERQ